jgi:hypothetical protein
MAGLVPAIHVFKVAVSRKTWVRGSTLAAYGGSPAHQHTVLNRSMHTCSTSSPGRFHQSAAEKISTSWVPR